MINSQTSQSGEKIMLQNYCETHKIQYFSGSKKLGGQIIDLNQCPQCLLDDVRQQEVAKMLIKRDRIKQDNVFLPNRYKKSHFSNYQCSHEGHIKAKADCESFAKTCYENNDCPLFLLLLGNSGNGKTHLAASILNDNLLNEKNRAYWTLKKIIRYIRDAYQGDGPTEQQRITYFENLDLLVIDEVGRVSMTEKTLQLFFEIIDYRYSQMKYTVLISNLNQNQILKEVGKGSFRRIIEDALVVDFWW